MSDKLLLATLLGINALILLFQIEGLSISYYEALIVYEDSSFLHSILNIVFSLFGQNDYTLRIPMIFLHLISALFLYGISSYYVSRSTDRLWIVFIYLLLPGVTSAALVVDNSGLVIALLFSFVYLYLRYDTYVLLLTPLLIVIDSSFIVLFLGFILYGVYTRKYLWILVGITAFALSYYWFGFAIGGKPKGHFLDLLALYSAVFSPIVFIYLFYVLYRRAMTKEIDMLWMIASTAFGLSLLLSFRQKIEIQNYAPFLFLALPLAAQTFLHTYRIRLKVFRRRYNYLFIGSLLVLSMNILAVFFNQYLYYFLSNPKRHFAYPMHVVKDLSFQLKQDGINCLTTSDLMMQKRLQFYGISQCDYYRLEQSFLRNGNKVTISYINKPIYEAYVTKLNK